jgi:hypothetical protein
MSTNRTRREASREAWRFLDETIQWQQRDPNSKQLASAVKKSASILRKTALSSNAPPRETLIDLMTQVDARQVPRLKRLLQQQATSQQHRSKKIRDGDTGGCGCFGAL